MVTQRNPTTGVRLTDDDRKLVKVLKKKKGVGLSQLIRLGLRALAKEEGIA